MMFFFKHKTAYEVLISDWSSDVCFSDLKLGLYPFKTRLQLWINLCVPCWVLLIDLLQHSNTFPGQRMCAGIAVGLGDGQAKLLILELLEKGDATLPAHRCLAQVTRAGEVGRAFLIARKGEIFAHRSLLSRSHDAHASFASARGHGSCAP